MKKSSTVKVRIEKLLLTRLDAQISRESDRIRFQRPRKTRSAYIRDVLEQALTIDEAIASFKKTGGCR